MRESLNNPAEKIAAGVYKFRGHYIAHLGAPFGWATVYPDKLDTMNCLFVGRTLQDVIHFIREAN